MVCTPLSRFANGRIPASQLVWFKALNQFGNWESFRATPATAARLKAFFADVKANTGVQLYITSGPNVYRDYAQQVAMRQKYANLGKPTQAALPGTSSHGGEYRGADSLAADISNYRALPWSTFTYYAHKHGFITNFVTPTEYWHIGDPNPWTMPKSSAPAKPEGLLGMTNYTSYYRDKSLKLRKGKTIVPLENRVDTPTSALITNSDRGAMFSATFGVAVSGLDNPREVQVRAVATDGNTTKVLRSWPIQEIVGTGGQSFGVLNVVGKLNKGERLRLQVETFTEGVTLATVHTSIIFE